jgi:hypothetical protein
LQVCGWGDDGGGLTLGFGGVDEWGVFWYGRVVCSKGPKENFMGDVWRMQEGSGNGLLAQERNNCASSCACKGRMESFITTCFFEAVDWSQPL